MSLSLTLDKRKREILLVSDKIQADEDEFASRYLLPIHELWCRGGDMTTFDWDEFGHLKILMHALPTARQKTDEEDDDDETYDPDSPHLNEIHISIDRLIGKWIKTSKYFTINPKYYFCNFAFLLPQWTGVFSKFGTRNTPKQFCSFVLSIWPVNSMHNRGHMQLLMIKPFPWAFVRIADRSTLQLFESDFSCSRPFKLLSTSDPKIFVMTFSNILNNAKSCAKILRLFLKQPERFDYQQNSFYVTVTTLIDVDIAAMSFFCPFRSNSHGAKHLNLTIFWILFIKKILD